MEPVQSGNGKDGKKKAKSRGQILYDTLKNHKGGSERTPTWILFQEDGGGRGVPGEDRDLAFVSRCL